MSFAPVLLPERLENNRKIDRSFAPSASIYINKMQWMNLLDLLGYVETILMVIISFLIGEEMDADSYPLFICLVLAMSLIIFDGVYKQRAKEKNHVV